MYITYMYTCRQEVFISEVEVMRQELIEKDVTVEGEFMSDAKMIEEDISDARREAIKKHCRTNPRQLMRTGPYAGMIR